MRVPHQLMVLSVLIITAASASGLIPQSPFYSSHSYTSTSYSSIWQPEQVEQSFSVAEDNVDSVRSSFDQWLAGADADDETGLLVQEPSRRSSRRPSIESPSKYNHRASYAMLKAFGEALGDSWKGTVELVIDEERVAYGAIVDADGFIVTKESQLPAGKLICRFYNGDESLAEVVDRSSSLDLALVRVPDKNLKTIKWSEAGIPPRGNWVATPNTQSIPAAVGVVSAGLLSVSARKPVMGVQLKEDKGPVVQSVVYGSGADMAGLLPGDRIRSIDGRSLASQSAALEFLSTCRAGQSVKLTLQRGEDEVEASVRMMDFSEDLRDETEMEVNGLISARSSGFSSIYMHDTVLKPNQCGGPLVDLNGEVVGINIARAGRVSSYALPVSTVRAEVDRMLSSAKDKPALTASKVVSER